MAQAQSHSLPHTHNQVALHTISDTTTDTHIISQSASRPPHLPPTHTPPRRHTYSCCVCEELGVISSPLTLLPAEESVI